jgi:hypothetical protein
MGTDAPTPSVIPLDCAPKNAPCPKCGKRGRRKAKERPALMSSVVKNLPTNSGIHSLMSRARRIFTSRNPQSNSLNGFVTIANGYGHT